ncbi:MAG: DUF6273 domain-containing protein [Eubacteriales bacterium]|nr:DUF6273 domain-containing protein [Eubacteriales bacterium]MDD3881416.1 DUF6273 domain-containing protein [Eubacteriales bacterium]MDD4513103.1 DUF6273 domain-containing protein [Eubacteriales bacterium]
MLKRSVAILISLALILAYSFAFADDSWFCPNCGKGGNTSNFCPDCGTARPADADAPANADSDVKVGTYVKFGSYEQDNDTLNGAEAIEWKVLEVEGGEALLISRYALENKPFNDTSSKQTWSNSSLRSWLNHTFLKAAFTADEQESIASSSIDESYAQAHPDFPPKRLGENTTDKVFLLSYAEMIEYMPDDYDRLCAPTKKAVSDGGNVSSERFLDDLEKTSWYWLRSPAFNNNIVCVNWDGALATCYMSHPYGVVRPCIRVKLSAID